MEESRRAHIGSPGGSADAPKFWRYGSTSKLFENDTSIFSLGTGDKVGEPTETNNGETSLHYWTLFYFQITLAACFVFFTDASPAITKVYTLNCEHLICYILYRV